MALDFDGAYAGSRDRVAFANGSEGYGWQAKWCDRCLRDAPFRNLGKGSGCPLILVAMQDRTPAEWVDGPRDESGAYSIADQYLCVEFRPPGGGGEPRPIPDPPDQGALLGRGEWTARRMFVPMPEDRPAEVVSHVG